MCARALETISSSDAKVAEASLKNVIVFGATVLDDCLKERRLSDEHLAPRCLWPVPNRILEQEAKRSMVEVAGIFAVTRTEGEKRVCDHEGVFFTGGGTAPAFPGCSALWHAIARIIANTHVF